ncbi:uncharacterized protein LOC116211632 [Punica granatum]|uniref:DUF4220 domain-containing protein n=2 Tax=Punica granatum TaxID=22663 RepID=A0A218XMX9_PUNGR|nr:uncharacterized protein LOC116211632 [Punica granatum]OWM86026.1 hypothetical protein CDL15_Pgr027252 [Punica granatum]PKI69616.1 hypothetical protein CRG98_009971 [Punica granatum]
MGLPGLRKLWDEWGLRVMVLLMLLNQILLNLIMLSRRARFRSLPLKFLLWLCYSSADAIVIFVLGMVSFQLGLINKNPGSLKEQDKLIAFWGPILTLFLGGPDTITAYSLEDNELWKRQLLGVIAQSTGTFSIILMAWSGHSYLSYLSLVMLGVASVKCGEKTWVLWNASTEKLQMSMQSPNPGPNYPKFTEEYCLRQEEGYDLGFHEISEVHEPMDPSIGSNDPKDIVRAHALFPSFRRLFANLILSDHDKIMSMNIFQSIQSAKDAFRVVEIELHFMYEQLHTKANLLYRPWAVLVRLLLVILTFSMFGIFIFFARQRWKDYSRVDLVVTLILLASVCVQELLSLCMIVYSFPANDWHRHRERSRIIPCLDLLRFKQPRWSNSMGQFCLLRYVIQSRTRQLLHVLLDQMLNLEKTWYTDYVVISQGLKGFILSSIRRQIDQANGGSGIGGWNRETAVDILRKHNIRDSDHKLSWSMQLEFDHCILIWHIATELWCQKAEEQNLRDDNVVWSRLLSRYMVYLLVNHPTMLPNSISHIRIQDTLAEASGFFNGIKSPGAAYKEFYGVKTAVDPLKVKGSISKSVLFDGRRLESGLIIVERDLALCERNWRMIADVWFHFLVCAAKQCPGSSHAKQLRSGGELLTQVWMLMAHFGLTDHFQLEQGSVISMLTKS